jgi:site-specific recombinase XerD
MAVESRNGILHIRMQVLGRKVRESTGLKDNAANRRKAAAIEQKRREELNNEARFGVRPIEVMRCDEGFDRFVEWLRAEHNAKPATFTFYYYEAKRLKGFFRNELISALRPGDVENVKMWRTNQGLRPSTVRLTLVALSKFFEFAKRHGWCLVNPCKEVRFPSCRYKSPRNVVTPEEEALYFRTARQMGLMHVHDHCRLMLLLGTRPQELRYLKKADVDLQKLCIQVTKCKTPSAARELTLVQEAVEILARRMKSSSTWVFPAVSPRKGKDGPWSNRTALNQHWRVCRSANLSFTPYDLRHSFATRMAQLGVDLPTLAALLGHSGLGQVMTYVHITAAHKKSAMEKYEKSIVNSESCTQDIPA